jgi:hypothetical protein
MKKVVRLKESELVKLITKILSEQDEYKLDVVDPNQSQVDGGKLEQINSQLSQVGVPSLTDQDVKDFQSISDCPMEEPTTDPQQTKILNQVKNNIEKMKVGQILSDLKKLRSAKRNSQKKMNEQLVEALTIAGVTIPGGAVLAIGGFIALLLLVKLVKLIFGGGGSFGDCKKKFRLFSKYGPSGPAGSY